MADRASAIILSKRHILLIHRIREEHDFYVFPGGNIEAGESAEQACIREVLEETGLQVAWLRYGFDHAAPARIMHYFFVQVHPGTMALGGPEALRQSQGNRYLLEWIPLAHIGKINLQPAPVRQALEQLYTEKGTLREARDLALHCERLIEILDHPTGKQP